jgi:hypothetical protein
VDIYPLETLVIVPSVKFKAPANVRRLAVLNPAHSPNKTSTILMPSELTRDFAIDIGYSTTENGLFNLRDPWTSVSSISKNCELRKLQPNGDREHLLKANTSSSITVDGVKVEVIVTQQCWWARTSRNLLISLQTTSAMRKNNSDLGIPSLEKDGRPATCLPQSSSFESIPNLNGATDDVGEACPVRDRREAAEEKKEQEDRNSNKEPS